MAGDRLGHLGSADGLDPVARLFAQLPPLWYGPIIGPGIADWASISENGERRLDLTGLPDPFPAELAWMAHWQALDGTRSSVLATNQLANILRRAAREDHPFPGSMRDMDWDTASVQRMGWENWVPRPHPLRIQSVSSGLHPNHDGLTDSLNPVP